MYIGCTTEVKRCFSPLRFFRVRARILPNSMNGNDKYNGHTFSHK